MSLSHASTITVEAITTIQTQKKRHKSLGTVLTTYRGRSTQTILQWFSSTPMLILSAIRHFVRILFIAFHRNKSLFSWLLNANEISFKLHNFDRYPEKLNFKEILQFLVLGYIGIGNIPFQEML